MKFKIVKLDSENWALLEKKHSHKHENHHGHDHYDCKSMYDDYFHNQIDQSELFYHKYEKMIRQLENNCRLK